MQYRTWNIHKVFHTLYFVDFFLSAKTKAVCDSNLFVNETYLWFKLICDSTLFVTETFWWFNHVCNSNLFAIKTCLWFNQIILFVIQTYLWLKPICHSNLFGIEMLWPVSTCYLLQITWPRLLSFKYVRYKWKTHTLIKKKWLYRKV